MKLLHTADWHLGKKLGSISRLEEQKAVLEEICTIADREDVDAVLIAGDVFDTFNPANDSEDLFYSTCQRLSKNGQRLVVVIAGNHDAPAGLTALNPLARANGILFLGTPTEVPRLFNLDTGLRLLRADEGFVEVKLPHHKTPLRLFLAPYANTYRLKKMLSREDSAADLRLILSEQWQNLAEKYADTEGVNLLMAHLYFMRENGPMPAEPEEERPINHLGGASAVFSRNVPPQMQYVALGHLHRRQTIDTQPCPIVYSGSPLAYSFAEDEQDKYVLLLQAEAGQPIDIQPIKLEKVKKLYQVRFESEAEALTWLAAHPDCWIQLTLVSNTYPKASDLERLFQAHDGIVPPIIPEVKTTETAEVESGDIDLQEDIRSLFVKYFQSKNKQQLPNDTLLALFEEILGHQDQNDPTHF